MLVSSGCVGFISLLKSNSSKGPMLACVFLIPGKQTRPLLMGQAYVLKRYSSVVPDWQQDRLYILARVWPGAPSLSPPGPPCGQGGGKIQYPIKELKSEVWPVSSTVLGVPKADIPFFFFFTGSVKTHTAWWLLCSYEHLSLQLWVQKQGPCYKYPCLLHTHSLTDPNSNSLTVVETKQELLCKALVLYLFIYFFKCGIYSTGLRAFKSL